MEKKEIEPNNKKYEQKNRAEILTLSYDRQQLQVHYIQVDLKDRLSLPA